MQILKDIPIESTMRVEEEADTGDKFMQSMAKFQVCLAEIVMRVNVLSGYPGGITILQHNNTVVGGNFITHCRNKSVGD